MNGLNRIALLSFFLFVVASHSFAASFTIVPVHYNLGGGDVAFNIPCGYNSYVAGAVDQCTTHLTVDGNAYTHSHIPFAWPSTDPYDDEHSVDVTTTMVYNYWDGYYADISDGYYISGGVVSLRISCFDYVLNGHSGATMTDSPDSVGNWLVDMLSVGGQQTITTTSDTNHSVIFYGYGPFSSAHACIIAAFMTPGTDPIATTCVETQSGFGCPVYFSFYNDYGNYYQTTASSGPFLDWL